MRWGFTEKVGEKLVENFSNRKKNFLSIVQRSVTYFVRGSITVWLTSCLTGLDLTQLVNVYLIQHNQIRWILTSQTGGWPCSDTCLYKVSECSLKISNRFYYIISILLHLFNFCILFCYMLFNFWIILIQL